ncbi:MAG: hypothetical protein H8E24_00670, partial [Verrucomicrobia bacterium]|nr:hypothetical protein [Verrucomicrobiota bacterium]
MRKAVSFLALSFLCGVHAEAGEPSVCRWTYVPPVIDGKGDDPAWKNAASVGPLRRAGEKDPAQRKAPTPTAAQPRWGRGNPDFFPRKA